VTGGGTKKRERPCQIPTMNILIPRTSENNDGRDSILLFHTYFCKGDTDHYGAESTHRAT